jgi:ribosomal protein L40E
MDLFTYLHLFNITTLIKPMNEEEEAPLEDSHVCRNCLAWERHAPGLKKPFCFPGYLSHGTDLFTYLHLFNITTLIKPMNEEEEEAPLEDSRVCRNCFARERHAPDLRKINTV